MALVWRVLAALTAVNAFALLVFIGLASLQFDAILTGLIRDRLEVLARTARDPFQAVTDLGLPLGTVRNARAILELVRQSDDEIAAVHVYGPDGLIVHSTRPNPPAALPHLPLAVGPDGGTPTVSFETADSFVMAQGIVMVGGGIAGGVVIEYSRDGARTQVLAMAARLGLIAGGVLAAITLLGVGALRFALRDHVRVFGGVLAAFDRFERRYWRGESGTDEEAAAVRGLGVDSAEFSRLLDRSEEEYQTARQNAALRGAG